METNDQQPIDPESQSTQPTVPPSAMPLSMPPVTAPLPVAHSTEEVPVTTTPPSAMPLSMPPFTPLGPGSVAGEPVGASGSGSIGGPPSWTAGIGWPDPFVAAPSPEQRRGHRGLVAVAVAALLAGGLGAGLGVAFSSSSSSSGSGGSGTDALAVPSSTPKATKALSVAAIYKLVTPAVVDINTVIASPASQGTSSQAAGTGMIVSSNGLILTNNHVIKDATQIQVTISGRRTPYTATVVGTSVKNDIALLKVNGVSNLPTVSLGNSSTIAVGDTAVAVGNARGLGGSPSLAQGQISALGRTITAGDESSAATETLHNLIETNAQIQPGDSGGPLLDSKGQVIGMDTAASASDTSSATLGFAIPINQAKQIAVAIEEGKSTAANGVVVGLSPFLGVFESQGSALNPFGNFSIGGGSTQACATTTTVTGASISDVISNGPAANAGIAGGDTVTSVAGKQVTGWSSLASVVAGLHPGEKVPVTYADSCGTTHSTSVVIGGIPA